MLWLFITSVYSCNTHVVLSLQTGLFHSVQSHTYLCLLVTCFNFLVYVSHFVHCIVGWLSLLGSHRWTSASNIIVDIWIIFPFVNVIILRYLFMLVWIPWRSKVYHSAMINVGVGAHKLMTSCGDPVMDHQWSLAFERFTDHSDPFSGDRTHIGGDHAHIVWSVISDLPGYKYRVHSAHGSELQYKIPFGRHIDELSKFQNLLVPLQSIY